MTELKIPEKTFEQIVMEHIRKELNQKIDVIIDECIKEAIEKIRKEVRYSANQIELELESVMNVNCMEKEIRITIDERKLARS
jgi:rRNA-processing protein FCF1